MCWNVGMCEAPLHRGDTSERFRLHVFARSSFGIMTYIGRELRTQFLSSFFVLDAGCRNSTSRNQKSHMAHLPQRSCEEVAGPCYIFGGMRTRSPRLRLH